MELATTLLILLLASSCNGKGGSAGDGVQPGPEDDTVDADGDGYPSDVDCDDEDETIHPGAGELCDGVDENCDGQVDEDAINATDWYADEDDDGFGDEDGFVERSCEAPDGTVDDATDCDDGDAAVNPDADEICNDIDDNCDGVIDSDAIDRREWYVDADGDGWGTGEPSTPRCGPIDGYSDIDGDCNDHDPAINPDAEEVLGDRIDNDCDGRSNGIWGEMSLGSVGCRIHGDASANTAGDGLSAAGDWNGDGLADFVVGAPYASKSYTGRGFAAVVLGPCVGPASLSDAAYATFEGETKLARAGTSATVLGDVDGDGVDDLAVGADWDSSVDSYAGAAYLILGGVSGAHQLSDAYATWRGDHNGVFAGHKVSAQGDLSGDGVIDLVINAEAWTEVGADDNYRGAVYVVSGAITGVHSLSEATTGVFGEQGAWTGDGLPDYLGEGLDVADVDGDGAADLLVGAFGAGEVDEGEAYLFSGPVSGLLMPEDADIAWNGVSTWSAAGKEVNAGADLNGDGYTDIAIGANAEGESPTSVDTHGAAYVVFGPPTDGGSLADADFKIEGECEQLLGSGIVMGDLDGDDREDIMVSGPSNSTTSSCGDYEGWIWVMYGPLTSGTWLPSDADATLGGEATGDSAGWPLAVVGDTDGDGFDDLLVGAMGSDDPEINAGAAYLLPGGDG